MDFYNFFSFSAKQAIYRSSEICAQFNNQYLEPEHAFYSILNLRSCSALQVLHQLGVGLPKLNYALEAHLYGRAGKYKGNAVFSQRMITLLDSAYKEVKRLHHREIGTTHLLIALAQDKSNFLRSLFDEMKLDVQTIRDTYLAKLRGYSQAELSYEVIEQGAAFFEARDSLEVAYDPNARFIVRSAVHCARNFGHDLVRPAHLLYAACMEPMGMHELQMAGYDPLQLLASIVRGFKDEKVEQTEPAQISRAGADLLGAAYARSLQDSSTEIRVDHLLAALASAEDLETAALLGADPEARQRLITPPPLQSEASNGSAGGESAPE